MLTPLTQVTGPEFLLLFAILIAAVALVCWRRKQTRDTSLGNSPVEPVDEIDPYEVAYLRGQAHELARVLIVRLVETRYLQISASKTFIEQSLEHPPVEELSAVELTAFEWFDTPRTPLGLPSALLAHTVRYEHKLRVESLLTTDEWKTEANKTAAIGVAVVLLIGVMRMIVGITRDKPVGFLVLMGIAGTAVIIWLSRPGRLSRRGLAYLDAIRQKWGWLQERDQGPEWGSDWSPSLAAGVFGISVLDGTEWSPVANTFRRAQDTSATSVGGACGGGGGDGGGGGGGGGGCGGGGCGGCGGS
jgi:uncharacterized protein (TIGR04222 family)